MDERETGQLYQENKRLILEIIQKNLEELKEIKNYEKASLKAKTIQTLVETSLSM